MLLPVTRKQTWIPVAIAIIAILLYLNPSAEQHRTAFLQSAEASFFNLSPDYQQIFQELRSEALRGKVPDQIRYDNFLLFSILKHSDESKALTGQRAKTRLLTIGAMGIVLPVGF